MEELELNFNLDVKSKNGVLSIVLKDAGKDGKVRTTSITVDPLNLKDLSEDYQEYLGIVSKLIAAFQPNK